MDLLVETIIPAHEKCGEIIATLNTDQRLYTLKCTFCEERFTTLFKFIDHVEDFHIPAKENKKDLQDKSEHISTFSLAPKAEYLDEDSNEFLNQLDPLIQIDAKHTDKEDDGHGFTQAESVVKMESDGDVSSNSGFVLANQSKAAESSDTEGDSKNCSRFLEDELEFNQDLSLALIEGLEKLPVLWKKSNYSQRNRLKREEALRILAKDLNKQFNKRIAWTDIDERIQAFRKLYRSELIKEENAKRKGEVFCPSMFFHKLAFLRGTVKPKGSKSQVKIKQKPTESCGIPFNDVEHEQFIKIYESFPCLWNIEDIRFKSKAQRDKATKDMLAMIEDKMHLELSEDELQRKLQRIRAACTKEKHEMFNAERLGTSFKPSFKYFSNIAFLMDNVCPFKCPFCSKLFKGREIFRVHKAEHDGSSPFTCTICKKNFSSPGNLAIHLRRHNRDYPYECKPCSKKFATTDEYNIHLRQHSGEKPYFCEVCGKSFATCSLFGRHKRRHDKRPTHFCEVCNRAFYEQIRYKEHMNIHNNIRDRVCDVCGKGFTHLKYLTQHKLIHTGRRDYICTICGKDFAQSAGLYYHMKTHGTKVSDKMQNEVKVKVKDTVKLKKAA